MQQQQSKAIADIDQKTQSMNRTAMAAAAALAVVAVVAVVDLYGGSIQAVKLGAASARSQRNGLFLPPTRCKVCKLHFVDPQLFLSRPGLLVFQVLTEKGPKKVFHSFTSFVISDGPS
jgi:hypothetical protein